MTPDRLNIGYSLSWHCLIHCMVSEKKVQLVNLFHALRYDEQFMGVRIIIKVLVVLCILHCFIALRHLSVLAQAKIIMEDGTETTTGVGELCIRSPSLFKEYWKRPEV